MNKKMVRVLLIEDNPLDVEIIDRALDRYRRLNFEVVSVDSTRAGRKVLSKESVDVVLLDYNLPGDDGLALLRSQNGGGRLPPVIMLTGQEDVAVAKEANRLGALDYVSKESISPDLLGDTIRDAMELSLIDQQLGSQARDLQKLAEVDELTGLFNRHYFDQALTRESRRTARYGNYLSCLMIDLDDFKDYYNAYGQLDGDGILRQVAMVISSHMRDTDIAARYGDDRFSILLPETPPDVAAELAESLRVSVATMQLVVQGMSISVSLSIGVFSPLDEHQARPDTIRSSAEAALLQAKNEGKNKVCIHHAAGIARSLPS